MWKRRTQSMLLLAIAAVLITAAFLLLDFNLQQARMSVDSSRETYTFSIDENTTLPLEQDIDLYVDAPLNLQEELEAKLSEELPAVPYVRDVNLLEGTPDPSENSILIVEILEPAVEFWSPFYTRTLLTVDVAYASDGEVAWIDEPVVRLNNQGVPEPVVRVHTEHNFDGSAYGLISRSGHNQYLAEEIAGTISHSLAATLASQGST
jgi:hypothetical protein